jgi:hypothetical protein
MHVMTRFPVLLLGVAVYLAGWTCFDSAAVLQQIGAIPEV